MKAPFPWFGGKSRAANLVWSALGDVESYVEPFAGSLAVLLARPSSHKRPVETVNDLDCYLANLWRAMQYAPAEVAHWADDPVNEADLHARHQWLVDQSGFRESMATDPHFYDAKIAGWWVWGQSAWIGSGWCDSAKWRNGNRGMGVNRQLPHLGNAGRGVHRQLPHLGDAGRGQRIRAQFEALAARLDRVRIACGSWERVLSDAVLRPTRRGFTGVLLDPPYALDRSQSYATDTDCSDAVRAWAVERQGEPWLRIALCGYEGQHDMPGWQAVSWGKGSGYQQQGAENNQRVEVVWLSPSCAAQPEQGRLAL